jgi:hypothetical protein
MTVATSTSRPDPPAFLFPGKRQFLITRQEMAEMDIAWDEEQNTSDGDACVVDEEGDSMPDTRTSRPEGRESAR